MNFGRQGNPVRAYRCRRGYDKQGRKVTQVVNAQSTHGYGYSVPMADSLQKQHWTGPKPYSTWRKKQEPVRASTNPYPPVFKVARNPRSPLPENKSWDANRKGGYWLGNKTKSVTGPESTTSETYPLGSINSRSPTGRRYLLPSPRAPESKISFPVSTENQPNKSGNATTQNQGFSTTENSINVYQTPPFVPLSFHYPPPVQTVWNASSGPGVASIPAVPAQPIWTELFTPEGHPYYYNSETKVSTWEKPFDFQTTTTPLTVEGTKEQLQGSATVAVQTPKPVISKSIPSSLWWIVGTDDGNMYFFNVLTHVVLHNIPPELQGRPDLSQIYQIIINLRQDLEIELAKQRRHKSAEESNATQNALVQSGNDMKIEMGREDKDCLDKNMGKLNPELTASTQDEVNLTGSCEQSGDDRDVTVNVTDMDNGFEKENSEILKDAKTAIDVTYETSTESINLLEKELSLENLPTLKGVDIDVAERLAAKQREIISLEKRKERFQELLEEKEVSPFSTWTKELPKIVFDPRYLLLTSKERKSEFDLYVKTRAAAEPEEVKIHHDNAKKEFIQFVDRVLEKHRKLIFFNDFERKYAKDARMNLLENPTERRQIFIERFRHAVRSENSRKSHDKRDKGMSDENKKLARERSDFRELLREFVRDYRYKWNTFYQDFDLGEDARFANIRPRDMKNMFKTHRYNLKHNIHYKYDKENESSSSSRTNTSSGEDECSMCTFSPAEQNSTSDKECDTNNEVIVKERNAEPGEILTDSE